MLCSFLVAGEPCGAPAESYRQLSLCPDHRAVVRLRMAPGLGLYVRSHALQSFPGYVYVARLPGEWVKIGYSNTFAGVSQRLKKHAARYGYALPVLVLRGGYAAEWDAHQRFDHLRAEADDEAFRLVPELQFWVDEQRLGAAAVPFRTEEKVSRLEGREVCWHKVFGVDE